MSESRRFPCIEVDPSLGAASALPYLPLTLVHRGKIAPVSALVDSGAALNVLPYSGGLQLGAVREEQATRLRLSGNLAGSEARALVVTAKVDRFEQVRLAFAWTRNDEVPVILGQVNFFLEFDVSFSRSRSMFEIRPRESERR